MVLKKETPEGQKSLKNFEKKKYCIAYLLLWKRQKLAIKLAIAPYFPCHFKNWGVIDI